MKFLALSEDMPRIKEQGVRVEMPRPNPGVHEHRLYFDFETREVILTENDVQTAELVPVAKYVSVLASSVPTDQQWAEVLTGIGFGQSKINEILTQ